MSSVDIASRAADPLLDLYVSPYWGILLSNGLFGITLVQAWNYLLYTRDKWPLRSLVVTLLILDATTVGLDAAIARYYFHKVTDDVDILLSIPIELGIEAVITSVVTFIVQLFFASRVYAFNKNKFVIGFIVLTATTSFIAGIMLDVDTIRDNSVLEYANFHTELEVVIFCAMSALCDISVTVFLSRALYKARSNIKRTNTVLQKLLLYVVSRGFLVSIVQCMYLVVYVAIPGTLHWSTMHFLLSRIYIITMLAMLNARVQIRDDLYKSEITDSQFMISGLETTNAESGAKTVQIGSLQTDKSSAPSRTRASSEA